MKVSLLPATILVALCITSFTIANHTQAGIVNLSLKLTDDERIEKILKSQLGIIKDVFAKLGKVQNGTEQDSKMWAPCMQFAVANDTNAQIQPNPITYQVVKGEDQEFEKGILTFITGSGSDATSRIYDFGMSSTSAEGIGNIYLDISTHQMLRHRHGFS